MIYLHTGLVRFAEIDGPVAFANDRELFFALIVLKLVVNRRRRPSTTFFGFSERNMPKRTGVDRH